MNFPSRRQVLSLAVCVLLSPLSFASLPLEKAIDLVNQNDPWMQSSQLQEQAIRHQSDAIVQLPDPQLSMSLSNFPVNGFDFTQEAMTQVKVGVSQMFPRGDSNQITRQQLGYEAEQHPLLRLDRQAQNRRDITLLWLDSFAASQKIRLLQEDKKLFEQLSEIVKASYAVAQSQTRQQDVLRSQLELFRIEDRIEKLRIEGQSSFNRLLGWLPQAKQHLFQGQQSWQVQIGESFPTISTVTLNTLHSDWSAQLTEHPSILAFDSAVKAGFSRAELVEQKFSPRWGINASYGLRGDQPNGQSRADLFSVGVTFDLPLFNKAHYQSEVKGQKLKAQAIETQKRLKLQAMLAEVKRLARKVQQQTLRISEFRQSILQPMHQQSEASLTAYTNDEGDFNEVMRSRLAEMHARLEFVDLRLSRLKSLAQLNYYLLPEASKTPSADQQTISGE